MRFKAISIEDKRGRKIILRNAESSDAESLLQYLRATAAETPYLIREPEEVTLTAEQEKEFIQSCMDSKRNLMLVATIDGKYIGSCSVFGIGNFKRYAHRCDVSVALYRKYWGMGIGKAMLETVLKAAKELGYEQAELEVISDNENAIALYEKLGFVKYGTIPDNMKYSDGTYADADWMMKKL